jgi:hypothetical protein
MPLAAVLPAGPNAAAVVVREPTGLDAQFASHAAVCCGQRAGRATIDAGADMEETA